MDGRFVEPHDLVLRPGRTGAGFAGIDTVLDLSDELRQPHPLGLAPTLVDLRCGVGRAAAEAARRGWDLVLVEEHPALLFTAERRVVELGGRPIIRCAPPEGHLETEGSVDVVVCGETDDDVDLGWIAANARHMLRPGGLFVAGLCATAAEMAGAAELIRLHGFAVGRPRLDLSVADDAVQYLLALAKA